ncbi:MAG: hypothetical protein A2158_06675 [Chloroflexi bacterium RBG_13_46_14]|nr:MAG: hypothetical protein A2158_06675 [Chloroflexi bacterium RBG_13_46_14]
MSRRKGIIFTILITLVLLLPISLASASSAKVTYESDQALIRDAKVYAEYENVSLTEALERLRLMDVIGDLHFDLLIEEAETFGGGWIEHNPQFNFIVQFTRDGSDTTSRYLKKYPELASLIEIRDANISYQELREIQIKLMDDLESIGILAESEPDIKTGKVKLYVLNQDVVKDIVEKGELTLSKYVEIIVIPRMTELYTDVIGGHEVSYDTEIATTGFGALDGNNEVITTAGHFAYHTGLSDAEYDGSIDLDFVYTPFYSGTGADIAWYDPIGYDVTNRIQDSSSTTRGMLWIESYGSITPGDYIYKYGVDTGSSVGQVATVGYYQDGYSDYVRVNSISGNPLADHGDSGAPCYRGYTAIGSLVGAPYVTNPDPDDYLFYSVDKLSDEYGINVLTE